MTSSGQQVEVCRRVARLLARVDKYSLKTDKLRTLPGYRRLCTAYQDGACLRYTSGTTATVAVLVVVAAVLVRWELYNTRGISHTLLSWEGIDPENEQCTIQMPNIISELTVSPTDCHVCRDVTQVDRVSNITRHQFEQRYAYSSRPVLVTDGTSGWTAPDTFSFEFFRQLYDGDSPVMNGHKGCQFFPYKTEFKSLRDVFAMSAERAGMQAGEDPWYIGWSNCDSAASAVLRQHYSRPYFLPETSESSRLDWIFMGTPGFGAHMHIDDVRFSSWQAQLSGQKTWSLRPPYECMSVCSEMQVTVHPGEILVLDTNLWYHKTEVTSDSISISIGSEYD